MRDIPVGNGSLLVTFDDKYQIRDIYFPHVGQENHTEGYPSRFGVWANGEFSWIAGDDWQRELRYEPDTLVTDVGLTNGKLGITIRCSDTVASHDTIYLRRLRITNKADNARAVRVFLHHDFRIYENKVGDTAFYDPQTRSLIHYKKHRYFLINTLPHFDQFATGRKAFESDEGTWRDAEDGRLSGKAITEGSVDSSIAVHMHLDAGEEKEFFYWITAGTSHGDVERLNTQILQRGPAAFLDSTRSYWRAWLGKANVDLNGLSPEVGELYKRSLLVINTQTDHGGAILAANDHDVTMRATDHYSYMWARDGALVAAALDQAGYGEMTRKFFEFCCEIVTDRGYFLQKYNPDGTVASGWHSAWDARREMALVPIQEDETALVLWALWQHYERFRDVDFAHRAYRILTVKAADFMIAFRDESTGLPLASWNLWEDRRGVHTFTCATVVAGLRAAAEFAKLFDDHQRSTIYHQAATRMVTAMREHLYSNAEGRFLRSLVADENDNLTPDATVDASLFATFYFGCIAADDPLVVSTMRAVEERLLNNDTYGGVARFENDGYMRGPHTHAGNSWFICTLWLAEWYVATGDLDRARHIIEWVPKHTFPSGVLAEQFDPATGQALSVSPLTWSHSTYIATVHSYLDKLAASR